jgi:hypothetical protein
MEGIMKSKTNQLPYSSSLYKLIILSALFIMALVGAFFFSTGISNAGSMIIKREVNATLTHTPSSECYNCHCEKEYIVTTLNYDAATCTKISQFSNDSVSSSDFNRQDYIDANADEEGQGDVLATAFDEACVDSTTTYPKHPSCCANVDKDGDGVLGPYSACASYGNDCDDNDSNNYPGNTEINDNADNDCDGVPDDGCNTCKPKPKCINGVDISNGQISSRCR